MSEMIERVARALAPLAWAALGTGDTLAHANRRKASGRHARAAILAMQQATPSMVKAVDDHPDYLGYGDDSLEWIWRVMCTAALESPQ